MPMNSHYLNETMGAVGATPDYTYHKDFKLQAKAVYENFNT